MISEEKIINNFINQKTIGSKHLFIPWHLHKVYVPQSGFILCKIILYGYISIFNYTEYKEVSSQTFFIYQKKKIIIINFRIYLNKDNCI